MPKIKILYFDKKLMKILNQNDIIWGFTIEKSIVFFTKIFGQYFKIQGDQLNMAVCFWYLVKWDMSSVRYCKVQNISINFYRVP